MEGKVRHPREGDGVVLCGCQPFQDVATDGSTNNLFTANTLATQNSANVIGISPDLLNGPLAAQANLHEKYVFTDIMWEYVSNVATSQAGSFALGYAMDGAPGAGNPTTFSTCRQLVPSVVAPFRADRMFLHYHYDGTETFWTLADQSNTATSRQTIQGTLYGFPSASSIGAVTQGFINVWYRIELYQPTNSQGFTFSVETLEEREILKAIRARLFPKNRRAVSSKVVDWDEKARALLSEMDCHLDEPDGGWSDASSARRRR